MINLSSLDENTGEKLIDTYLKDSSLLLKSGRLYGTKKSYQMFLDLIGFADSTDELSRCIIIFDKFLMNPILN
jgi:hypothetical protein